MAFFLFSTQGQDDDGQITFYKEISTKYIIITKKWRAIKVLDRFSPE